MDSCNFNYLKEPQYSDRKQGLENYEIRRIKQMLISGNKEKVICAANEILSGIEEDNKWLINMIKSDVCGFLCNAMVPFESNISGTIYNCLAIMAKSKYFYIHGHASVAIEMVTRSMHFLIKSGPHDFSLRQPLKLLELIVKGYAQFHVQLEKKKPLKNLMTLISSLLRETITQRVKYEIGVIIKRMFNTEFLINPKRLISLSDKWLEASFIKNSDYSSMPEDFINLGCAISKEALSHLNDNNLTGMESDLEVDSESNITRTITIFLLEYASPYVMLKGNEVEKEGIERLEHYLMCLWFLLKDLFEQQQLIIHSLSEMRFIQLIYSILSDKYFNRFENLSKLCLSVLLEILLALSDDVFDFAYLWPDGRDNFRIEIKKGMCLLPVDASLWTDQIANVSLNRSGKLVLILFFYFYSLTIKSPSNENLVSIFPPAINLVNTIQEKTCSPLQIKGVWFIFVMSQMSKSWIRDGEALLKMLDILEAQTELTLLYTHHPAMLHWAFSMPGISYRIQCELIKLWLQNDSEDSGVLDNLVEKSEDVRLALVVSFKKKKLLENSDEHTTRMAFSALKTFMLSSDDDSLSSSIWFLLLQTLAKYTTDSSNVSALEVDYIMELATLRNPEQQLLSEPLRIASLLPEALKKTDLISLTSAVKLVLQLMEMSIQYDDSTVLSTFLRSGVFMQNIIPILETNLGEPLLYSLKIILILWKRPPNSMYLPPDYDEILLAPSVLLKIVNSKDMEIINTVLILIEQMLSDRFQSYLIRVQVSSDFLKILFFDLQNALMMYLPLISGRAWSCLKHCLKEDNSFAEDVLLNEVIKYGLEHLKDVPEIVDFLSFWMERRREIEKFYSGHRRVKQSYFLETICYIGTFLSENATGNAGRLCDEVLKCCSHFSIDTSIEPFNRLSSLHSDRKKLI